MSPSTLYVPFTIVMLPSKTEKVLSSLKMNPWFSLLDFTNFPVGNPDLLDEPHAASINESNSKPTTNNFLFFILISFELISS
jgi:hypothetical protein